MSENLAAKTARTAEECAELEYLLIGDLQELMEDEFDDTNRKWLLAVLDTLVEISSRHMVIEDANGGYMSEVLDDFPNWDEKVARLRTRKLNANDSIRRLRNHIRSGRDFQAIAGQVQNDLREWIAEFMSHRRHEIHLLQTACNWNPGGLG